MWLLVLSNFFIAFIYVLDYEDSEFVVSFRHFFFVHLNPKAYLIWAKSKIKHIQIRSKAFQIPPFFRSNLAKYRSE